MVSVESFLSDFFGLFNDLFSALPSYPFFTAFIAACALYGIACLIKSFFWS